MQRFIVILACFGLLSCGPVGDGMRYGAKSINKIRNDAVISYNEVKFFKPVADAVPQTQLRYCYQFISDIVCYDSPQEGTTSKLVAVQDGIPGRVIAGSTATSTVMAPQYAEAAPTEIITTAPNMTYGETPRPLAGEHSIEVQGLAPNPVTNEGGCTGDSPFPCKESGYVSGVDVGK